MKFQKLQEPMYGQSKSKPMSKLLKIIFLILIIGIILVFGNLSYQMSQSISYPNDYVIETNIQNSYKINSTFNSWDILFGKQYQTIPIKSYNKIGLEYFCTIELIDTLTISKIYNKYNKFSYELIRYKVWENLLLNHLVKNIYETDTFYFDDIKVYDIEPYTFEKYIEKLPNLYSV